MDVEVDTVTLGAAEHGSGSVSFGLCLSEAHASGNFFAHLHQIVDLHLVAE